MAVNNLTLFVSCVAIWSTTWFAITFQLGAVAAEVSVAWRFLLAALIVAAWCRLRRLPLRFAAADHGALALMGVLMYSAGYVCVYRAEEYLASGLVAVGFSACPLLAMFGLRLFFGQPLTARMAAGSLLGIAGIVLVFWPEFTRLSEAEGAKALENLRGYDTRGAQNRPIILQLDQGDFNHAVTFERIQDARVFFRDPYGVLRSMPEQQFPRFVMAINAPRDLNIV